MFFADIDTALAEMLRVLKSWTRRPFGMGAVRATLIRKHRWGNLALGSGDLDAGTGSRKVQICAPRLYQRCLRRTGFRNIEEQHMTLPRVWAGSPQDLWQYFQEISTLCHPLIRAIPAKMRSEVGEAVRIVLAQFQSGNTITVPVQVVLSAAEK